MEIQYLWIINVSKICAKRVQTVRHSNIPALESASILKALKTFPVLITIVILNPNSELRKRSACLETKNT